MLVDHAIRHGNIEHTNKDVLIEFINGHPEKITAAMLSKTEMETISVPGYSGATGATKTPSKKALVTPTGSSYSNSANDRQRADSHVLVGSSSSLK
jgi:hypothetical protein